VSQSIAPFEMELTIAPEDIDLMGHVNNIVYVRWIQQVATAHWDQAATPQEQATLLWMVTRHEIDYKRQAFLGDTLRARTWVGQARRRSFERHTEITRSQDGKLIAKALTLWCPVDAEHKKPTSVSDEVRQRFTVTAQD